MDLQAIIRREDDTFNYKYCIANILKGESIENCELLLYSTIERQRRASTLRQKDPAILHDV